jgi:diguanylate cyclase (GGDEF)-like protein
VPERDEIVEAMYRAAPAHEEIAIARERAAGERDSLANERDRAATERDALSNEREKALAAREALLDERDRAVTGRVATHASGEAVSDDEAFAAIDRARLEAELQRAHLDALTGAYRREMGRLAMRNEIERARRGDGRFTMAFVDVAGMKAVNERDGHAAGDRVLRTLVATMRANLRSYDPIVRYGGDEFICGIASVDPAEVEHRLGVIDRSLRDATGVGITYGMATLTDLETLDELMARADAAVVEAKRKRSE